MNIVNNFHINERFVKGKSDYPYSLMIGLAGNDFQMNFRKYCLLHGLFAS